MTYFFMVLVAIVAYFMDATPLERAVFIGVGIFAYLAWMAYKGKYTPEYYTPVENSGLYWHFVDIVWIYLFPLLYLIDRHR